MAARLRLKPPTEGYVVEQYSVPMIASLATYGVGSPPPVVAGGSAFVGGRAVPLVVDPERDTIGPFPIALNWTDADTVYRARRPKIYDEWPTREPLAFDIRYLGGPRLWFAVSIRAATQTGAGDGKKEVVKGAVRVSRFLFRSREAKALLLSIAVLSTKNRMKLFKELEMPELNPAEVLGNALLAGGRTTKMNSALYGAAMSLYGKLFTLPYRAKGVQTKSGFILDLECCDPKTYPPKCSAEWDRLLAKQAYLRYEAARYMYYDGESYLPAPVYGWLKRYLVMRGADERPPKLTEIDCGNDDEVWDWDPEAYPNESIPRCDETWETVDNEDYSDVTQEESNASREDSNVSGEESNTAEERNTAEESNGREEPIPAQQREGREERNTYQESDSVQESEDEYGSWEGFDAIRDSWEAADREIRLAGPPVSSAASRVTGFIPTSWKFWK